MSLPAALAAPAAPATPSTRQPCEANSPARCCLWRCSSSGRRHSASTASAAPLQAARARPCVSCQSAPTIGLPSASGTSCTRCQPSAADGPVEPGRARSARSIGSGVFSRVASHALCSSACTVGAGASLLAASHEPCAATARRRRMRFSVSVPVLSTASTVAAPSVSIAAERRTSTCCCASRQAPMTKNTVIASANSSGSSAIASAIADSTASIQAEPRATLSKTTPTLTTAASTPSTRTRRAVSRCNRVRVSSSWLSSAPMRPASLRAPVAVTSAMPWPATTSVPPKTVSATALASGRLSPVSSDSSTASALARRSTASAATRSPSSSSNASPGTTSAAGHGSATPPRSTRACGAAMARSASSALRLRWFCTSTRVTVISAKRAEQRAFGAIAEQQVQRCRGQQQEEHRLGDQLPPGLREHAAAFGFRQDVGAVFCAAGEDVALVESKRRVSDRPRHPAIHARCRSGSARPSTAVAACPGSCVCAC